MTYDCNVAGSILANKNYFKLAATPAFDHSPPHLPSPTTGHLFRLWPPVIPLNLSPPDPLATTHISHPELCLPLLQSLSYPPKIFRLVSRKSLFIHIKSKREKKTAKCELHRIPFPSNLQNMYVIEISNLFFYLVDSEWLSLWNLLKF